MNQRRQRGRAARIAALTAGVALAIPMLATATAGAASARPAGAPAAAAVPATTTTDTCPTPTPGLTLPVTPDHGVAQAQLFDRQVPDPSVYDGKVDFVWAASHATQPAGVVSSAYVTAFRNAPARTFTPAWFEANHPDWIEYTADMTTPAWEFGNQVYTPLDVGNPDYRQWYLTNVIGPQLAAGYKVIAVDNVTMRNDYAMSGHYDASGAWVQQFTSDPKDPAYAAYVLDWLGYLRDYLHSQGVALAVNITVNSGLNDQYHDDSASLIANINDAIDISDIWLNEQGFTDHRVENVTGTDWKIMLDLLSGHPCKPSVSVNKLPTTTWDQADPAQLQWIVANYYLYKQPGSMIETAGSTDYAGFFDIPQLSTDLGVATGSAHHEGTTDVWVRTYADGLTVVNPTTAPISLDLHGHHYVDQLGNAYTGVISVPAVTGLVLTTV